MRQQTPYWIPYSTSKAQHGLPWRNFIRKAQCHFSWDWGPTFLTQGIWLNATILAYSEAVVSYVVPQITQPDPQQNKWNVLVRVQRDHDTRCISRPKERASRKLPNPLLLPCPCIRDLVGQRVPRCGLGTARNRHSLDYANP